VGGIEDLNTRVVRAIGEPRLRLAEDPVRILRALKLAARYGFGIRPDLKEAIAEMAPSISLSSKARLFEEILKILLHAHTLSTFVLCRDHGLLNHLWPSLDAVWYTPVGDLTRRLMAERDRRVKAGGYSRSKTLALATICFAAVAEDLGSPAPGCLWEYRHGIESGCRDAVSRFFLPFRIPRFLSARVRDVLLLQPRFQARYSRRVTRHPEYKYARELFSALTSVMGWDASQLGAWPVPHGGHRGAAAEPPGEEDLTEPGGAVTEQ
jgi:poly(A) polymerase